MSPGNKVWDLARPYWRKHFTNWSTLWFTGVEASMMALTLSITSWESLVPAAAMAGVGCETLLPLGGCLLYELCC